MAIVAGRVLADHKHIWISLTGIFGIGRSTAIAICKDADLDTSIKVRDLTEGELDKIREMLTKYTIEGDLRREQSAIRKTLQSIGCYRGIRDRRALPRRGQRTKTNARTAKRLRRRA